MERFIGIDYGRKRVGVAVSDPLGIFASALETVSAAKIVEYLNNYIKNNKVKAFVVGYPMNLNNTPSEAAKDVDIFIKQLRKSFPQTPIILEDERFTSQLAMRSLIESGVKRMDRREKGAVDKVSAAIILQTYLDRPNKEAL